MDGRATIAKAGNRENITAYFHAHFFFFLYFIPLSLSFSSTLPLLHLLLCIFLPSPLSPERKNLSDRLPRGSNQRISDQCRSNEWLRWWGTFSLEFLQRDWFVDGFGVTVPRWSVRFLRIFFVQKKKIFCFGKDFCEQSDYLVMDILMPWGTCARWCALLMIVTVFSGSEAIKVSAPLLSILRVGKGAKAFNCCQR